MRSGVCYRTSYLACERIYSFKKIHSLPCWISLSSFIYNWYTVRSGEESMLVRDEGIYLNSHHCY